MAININANIELGSAQYLDARQSVKDLNTLLALNTNIIPNGFECYVEELDCKYKYHESYNDPSTGYWKISENGGEKKGEFITLEEYNELEMNGLVEQDKSYYILTNEVIEFEDKSYSPTSGILATNYFNNIADFSSLDSVVATSFNYKDTSNYNLVNITFPKIELSEDLIYSVYFRVIIYSGYSQRQLYKKININDLTIENDNMTVIIDATNIGLGDYIAENPDEVDTLKEQYFYASLLSCEINEDYSDEDTIIVNGVKNTITGNDFVIVNGENNEILNISKERTNSVYVSGKGNKLSDCDYEMVVGRKNKENFCGFGITLGTFNTKDYNDYCSIIGTRNYQWFGTYIPKSKWTNCNVDTSKNPVVITVKFNTDTDYNFLQDYLPEVGNIIGVHTFYGIRPSRVTEISHVNNIATITFKSVDSSEEDTTLQWGNYTNIFGIIFNDFGYQMNNTFISGEYNSSYAYGNGIFGFGNGSVANYGFVAGQHNQLVGEHSSAFGWGNIVSTDCGTAIGSFNNDVENSLFVVGNGTTKFNRSNALSLSKTGELNISGDLKYNGQTSLSSKLETIEEKLPIYSLNKPTTDGTVGDIVWNQSPTQGAYVGWIYTPTGWLGFGKIEASGNEDIP